MDFLVQALVLLFLCKTPQYIAAKFSLLPSLPFKIRLTKIRFIFTRENVGLLGLTRVGSRRVVQISAGFMIFFSTLGQYLTL